LLIRNRLLAIFKVLAVFLSGYAQTVTHLRIVIALFDTGMPL